jgi:hypothetical protein
MGIETDTNKLKIGDGVTAWTSLAYMQITASASANLAADMHAASSKTPPIDADEIPLVDSAASWGLKKLTWANLKATAKTYFDTLYAVSGHTHTGTYEPADADIQSHLAVVAGNPHGTTYSDVGAAAAAHGHITTAVQTDATRNETATAGLVSILCDAASNAITVNLPTAVGNAALFSIKKTDNSANAITVDPSSTQTIDGGSTAVLTVQYESISLVSDGSNWSII